MAARCRLGAGTRNAPVSGRCIAVLELRTSSSVAAIVTLTVLKRRAHFRPALGVIVQALCQIRIPDRNEWSATKGCEETKTEHAHKARDQTNLPDSDMRFAARKWRHDHQI